MKQTIRVTTGSIRWYFPAAMGQITDIDGQRIKGDRKVYIRKYDIDRMIV